MRHYILEIGFRTNKQLQKVKQNYAKNGWMYKWMDGSSNGKWIAYLVNVQTLKN
jgi:hypothetical protein